MKHLLLVGFPYELNPDLDSVARLLNSLARLLFIRLLNRKSIEIRDALIAR